MNCAIGTIKFIRVRYAAAMSDYRVTSVLECTWIHGDLWIARVTFRDHQPRKSQEPRINARGHLRYVKANDNRANRWTRLRARHFLSGRSFLVVIAVSSEYMTRPPLRALDRFLIYTAWLSSMPFSLKGDAIGRIYRGASIVFIVSIGNCYMLASNSCLHTRAVRQLHSSSKQSCKVG
jgi:hypothetical protein